MKINAELKETYKITVGDGGMCMGQYYSEDDWKESYYGDTIEEIAEKLNTIYFRRLPMAHFAIEKWQVLIYENKIYDHELLAVHSRWNGDSKLQKEYDEFFKLWNSTKYTELRNKKIEAEKIREERERKITEMKNHEEEEQKELEEYLKLKEKYETI
jgi:hypothetical protein